MTNAVERKKVEETMRRQAKLLDLSYDAMLTWEIGGAILSWNHGADELYGFTAAEAVGRDPHDLLRTAGLSMQELEMKLRSDGCWEGELVHTTRTGQVIKVESRMVTLKQPRRPEIVLETNRDITERRRAEEQYRTIVRTAMDGFWMTDLKGQILDVNDSYCSVIGYSRAELLKMHITDVEAAETPTQTAAHIQRIIRTGGDRFETQHRRKDGTVVDIEVSVNYLDAEGGRFFVFLRDITERKRAEQALAESEKRFRTALDNMLEGCVILDYKWRYLYANDSAVKMGRRTREERLGYTLMEVYPGIERQEVYTHLQRCMEERVPDRYVTEFTFPEGIKAWLEMRLTPVPEGILILYLDITERKRLEEELDKYRERLETVVAQRTAEFAQANERLTREIEEHARSEEGLSLRAAILDNAREAVFLLNLRGNFVYANEAAIRTYGYSRDEFLGMNLRQLVRPHEAPAIADRLTTVLRAGQLEVETIHVRKDKSLIPVEVRHSMLKTLHGQFIVSVVRDITPRPGCVPY